MWKQMWKQRFCTSAKVLTVNQRFRGQNLGRGAKIKGAQALNKKLS